MSRHSLHIAAYVLVVAVTAISSWAVARHEADRAAGDAATISYWQAVDACKRANRTVRAPLHDYLLASIGYDDAEVARAARRAIIATVPQRCLAVVPRIDPADPYVPPRQR